jgi:hypothetical protein
MKLRLLFIFALHFATGATHAAVPGIESWSAFKDAEVSSLAPGAIETKSNAAMTFPRGLSVQAIYVVDGNVEAAAQALRDLDPTRYPVLEVYQQREFHSEGDAHFSELKFDLKLAPFQRLRDEAVAPKHLQLSPEERAHLPQAKDAAAAQTFWSAALLERWTRFVRDGSTPAANGFDARGDLRALLQDDPKIAAHFSTLLQPWIGASGSPGAAAATFYWDVSNTDGLANLELGAISARGESERRQVADVTYYSSSGYIAAVSLFEFIPIAGRATQTLVWQSTLVSSAEVAGAFGLKRKIGVRTVETEMKQWIAIFRQACAGAKK